MQLATCSVAFCLGHSSYRFLWSWQSQDLCSILWSGIIVAEVRGFWVLNSIPPGISRFFLVSPDSSWFLPVLSGSSRFPRFSRFPPFTLFSLVLCYWVSPIVDDFSNLFFLEFWTWHLIGLREIGAVGEQGSPRFSSNVIRSGDMLQALIIL